MSKCIMCEKEHESGSKLCVECTRDFDEMYSMNKEIAIETIKSQYNIFKIEELPVLTCNCKGRPREVNVFDFYTRFNEELDMYDVVLCSQCRSCGGYLKFLGEQTSSYSLRNKPRHAGFTLMPYKKKRIDYII